MDDNNTTGGASSQSQSQSQKKWTPFVGEAYAPLVARGVRSMWLGLCSFVVAAAIAIALGAVVPERLSSLVTIFQVLFYCGGGAVLVYGIVKVQTASSRILRDLRARGIEVTRSPDLRGPNSFQAWCEKQHVTPEQVIETGRLKYDGSAHAEARRLARDPRGRDHENNGR